MNRIDEEFTRINPEPAEVIRPDFRGGREYRIDLGRVSLLDWHRLLMTHGADPELRERCERSLSETRKILDDLEFEEAQRQAYEILLSEKEK